MNESDKQTYINRATADRKKYDEEMTDFKKGYGRGSGSANHHIQMAQIVDKTDEVEILDIINDKTDSNKDQPNRVGQEDMKMDAESYVSAENEPNGENRDNGENSDNEDEPGN